MTAKPEQPPPHVMELVDPSYQPTKAYMENEWTVRDMTLDEAIGGCWSRSRCGPSLGRGTTVDKIAGNVSI